MTRTKNAGANKPALDAANVVTGGTTSEFEFIVEVNETGNLQLVEKTANWFFNSEHVVTNKGNVVFISVVGDESSGKSTLLDHIHYYLKDLEGEKGRGRCVKVFPTKFWESDSRDRKKGILLKTIPYSVRRNCGTVVKVFLVDIWRSSTVFLTDVAYTKMVDFCTAISSMVFYTSRTGNPKRPDTLNFIRPESSLLGLLPEKVFQRVVFCFFNWPHERPDKRLNSQIDRIRKFGKIEENQFSKWNYPTLTVTSKIVNHTMEVSKLFQHSFFFTGPDNISLPDQQKEFVTEMLKDMLKPGHLMPIIGEKGCREVETVEALFREVIQCVNRTADPASSAAFKVKSKTKPKAIDPSKVSLLASKSPSQVFKRRPSVKKLLRDTYIVSLMELISRNPTEELFFPADQMMVYHESAATETLTKLAKDCEDADETAEVISDCLNNAFHSCLQQKAQIELMIQEIITETISMYASEVSGDRILAAINAHEYKMKKFIQTWQEDLRRMVEAFISVQLQEAKSVYAFLFEFQSSCAQILHIYPCVPVSQFSEMLGECAKLVRQKSGLTKLSFDPVLITFVQVSVQSLIGRFEAYNKCCRQQEEIFSQIATEYARKFYNYKMELACKQLVFSAESLDKFHADLVDIIVGACCYSIYSNVMWQKAAGNLQKLLYEDLNTFYRKNELNANAAQQRWEIVFDQAIKVFDACMSVSISDCGRSAMRKYFDARDEALEAFQQAVSHEPGVLVKFWRLRLCEIIESKAAVERPASTSDPASLNQVGVLAKRPRKTENIIASSTPDTLEDGTRTQESALCQTGCAESGYNGSESRPVAQHSRLSYERQDNKIENVDEIVVEDQEEEDMEVSSNPIALELTQLVEEMRIKLDKSSTSRPMKKRITMLVDTAAKILSEPDTSDAKIKQSIDQLRIWDKQLI